MLERPLASAELLPPDFSSRVQFLPSGLKARFSGPFWPNNALIFLLGFLLYLLVSRNWDKVWIAIRPRPRNLPDRINSFTRNHS